MTAPGPAPAAVDVRDRPGANPLETLKLIWAWLFVGIPAAWGVWQVFQKSLALFQ